MQLTSLEPTVSELLGRPRHRGATSHATNTQIAAINAIIYVVPSPVPITAVIDSPRMASLAVASDYRRREA